MFSYLWRKGVVPTLSQYPDSYQIPYLGSYLVNYNKAQDFANMQADFNKNVGRSILYPYARGYYGGYATSTASASSNLMSGIGAIAGAGKSVRYLV